MSGHVPDAVTANWCQLSADAEIAQLKLWQRSDSAERVRCCSESSCSEHSPADERQRDIPQPAVPAFVRRNPSQSPPPPDPLRCAVFGSPTSSVKKLGTSPKPPQGAVWWARRLHGMTKPEDIPCMNRRVNCMSACTGASAESFVLKAFGLAFIQFFLLRRQTLSLAGLSNQ